MMGRAVVANAKEAFGPDAGHDSRGAGPAETTGRAPNTPARPRHTAGHAADSGTPEDHSEEAARFGSER